MAKINNQRINLAILQHYLKNAGVGKNDEGIHSQSILEAVRAGAEKELSHPVTMRDVENVVEFLAKDHATYLDAVIAFRQFFFGYLKEER